MTSFIDFSYNQLDFSMSQYTFDGLIDSLTMPQVTGLTLTAAVLSVLGAGLQCTVQETYSSSVAKGIVSAQNPVAGTVISAGQNVILTMSAGVAPKAGNGYDVWGATGGGIVAVNNQPPLGAVLATAQQPSNAVYEENQSVVAALAVGAISQATAASAVPTSPTMG
jgi:hypothetical protein